MLGKYTLLFYVRIFLVVSLMLLGIVSSYAFAEFFLLFKEKNIKVALLYFLNLLPLAFFYLLPITSIVSLMIVFRRVFSKKIDLITQSFGISPLKFSSSILLFLLSLCIINFFLSFDFYAKRDKNLYNIEKEFKKKQYVENLIVRNVWFLKDTNGERFYVNFQFVNMKDGKIAGIFILKSEEGSIKDVVYADKGLWKGDRVFLPYAKVVDFKKGEESIESLSFELVDISMAKPIGEKVQHISLSQLLLLYSLGGEMGLNYNLYMAEFLRRTLLSFSPFLILIITLSATVKKRSILFGFLHFLFAITLYWVGLSSVKTLAEDTSLSPLYGLLVFLPLWFSSLKGTYDLVKGFRV
ncbi:MAG: LptF/LptG family permease [Aquificaceae bacterium]